MFHTLHKHIVRYGILLVLCSFINANNDKPIKLRSVIKKNQIWVFVMAGQSNMAGRGIIEAEDTLTNDRILSIDKTGQLILAKEPLHFYESTLTGLDCGMAFARTLLKQIPGNISILIIPTAVGGSSISQWLYDSTHRGVQLFSNFTEKAAIAKKYGVIKGILWHQGESDTNEKDIPLYKQRLKELLSKFRMTVGNPDLPVIIGELGSYSNNQDNWNLLNKEIHKYSSEDKNSAVVSTSDLKDKGDHLHFDSKGQRELGKRFAETYINKFYKN